MLYQRFSDCDPYWRCLVSPFSMRPWSRRKTARDTVRKTSLFWAKTRVPNKYSCSIQFTRTFGKLPEPPSSVGVNISSSDSSSSPAGGFPAPTPQPIAGARVTVVSASGSAASWCRGVRIVIGVTWKRINHVQRTCDSMPHTFAPVKNLGTGRR